MKEKMESSLVKAINDIQILVQNVSDEEAKQLATALSCFPLPLTQAISYLQQTNTSIANYLMALEQFLKTNNNESNHEEALINATLIISVQHLKETSPDAYQILKICSLLAADNIPLTLFGHKDALQNSEQIEQVLRKLSAYALIMPAKDNAICINPVVQKNIKILLNKVERIDLYPTLVQGLDACCPLDENSEAVLRQINCIVPHLEKLSSFLDADRQEILPHSLALDEKEAKKSKSEQLLQFYFEVNNLLAICYYQQNNFDQQIIRLEKNLQIKEMYYGNSHYTIAVTLINLSNGYAAVNETEQRVALLERALNIQEAYYGKRAEQLAVTLGNLGNAYGVQGEKVKKKECLERALGIQEKKLGAKDASLVSTLVNLSNVYNDLRNYNKQRELLERALDILNTDDKAVHSEKAWVLFNLGFAEENLNDLKAARKHWAESQEIFVVLYGKDSENVKKVAQKITESGQTVSVVNTTKVRFHEPGVKEDDQTVSQKKRCSLQ